MALHQANKGSFDFVAAEDKSESTDSEVETNSDPFSSAGLVHWMYGRCDRRIHKAVRAKDPK